MCCAPGALWERRQRFLQLEDVRLERLHYLCQGFMRLMLAIKQMGEQPAPVPLALLATGHHLPSTFDLEPCTLAPALNPER